MTNLARVFVLIAIMVSTAYASTPQDDLVQAGDLINGSFEQRPLKKTGRYWDLAIRGSGFFPLQDSKTGEMVFTRLGHFELDRDGYVILSGHPTLRLVMQSAGKTGPLNLVDRIRLDGALMVGLALHDNEEPGAVSGVYTSGEVVKLATIVLAKFFNDGNLRAIEPNVFKAETAALPNALPMIIAPPTEQGLGTVVRRSLEQL